MPPEATTVVVTDTTAYLPDELIAEHGIQRVSLYVSLEGEQRPEIEIPGSEYASFYERLRQSEEGATTSQPSVGDFTAAFEPLLADGGEVISVHISGGLSGTPEAARQAKEALEREGKGGERVHVIDSTTAAGGLGFLVLAAVKGSREGMNGQDVVAHVTAAEAGPAMGSSAA